MDCIKRGFSSERAARDSMFQAGFRYRAYRCPHCWKWHVTNTEKRENLGDREIFRRQREEAS